MPATYFFLFTATYFPMTQRKKKIPHTHTHTKRDDKVNVV